MTFIDWSDSDEMLGLLVEYVADARIEARGDRSRSVFLERLHSDLADLATLGSDIGIGEAIGRLREIRNSVSAGFEVDPVMAHVDACIEELERINASAHT